jgi:Fe-Mn family superoxide dismutase
MVKYVYVEEVLYPMDALEPYISQETMTLHYYKHHCGYEDKLRALSQSDAGIHQIMNGSYGGLLIGDQAARAIYNNAAQIQNHNIFWKSLSPHSKTPSPELQDAIKDEFSSVDELKRQMISASASVFGSGWLWLVMLRGRLVITTTPLGFNPVNTTPGSAVLVAIDLWEHAYYVDYRQDRLKYVTGVVENLLDWDYASVQYMRSKSMPGF